LADALPERTAIFITDSTQSCDTIRRTALWSGARPVPIEFVPTQCPWLESATTSGMLPVPVIQRMLEWLP
jgi:hypothetical protein